MTNDDHAALIEVKGRLVELQAQQNKAKEASDWSRLYEIQAKINAAEAERIEIMRRTEPEDTPKL
jgi:uncharacterized membrane protein (DUF106 family)